MESQNLLEGFNQQGESPPVIDPVIVHDDEKIEVEIREIVRIRPQDFSALKNSFEDWSSKWQ